MVVFILASSLIFRKTDMSFQRMKGAPMFTIAMRVCFQICFHPVASQLYFSCHFPQLCCCFTNDSFTVSLTTNQFNSLLCCKGDAANGKNTPSKHQSKHSSSIIEGSIRRHNWETYCTCIYPVSLSSRVSGFSWKTSVTLQKNKKMSKQIQLVFLLFFHCRYHSPLALEVPECQVVHAYICKKLFQLLDQSLHTLHTAMDIKVRQQFKNYTHLWQKEWNHAEWERTHHTGEFAAALWISLLWVTGHLHLLEVHLERDKR